jgi:peptidoglycan/xylan/chitin deacetylase (PgdA/CDA1 family)
MAPSGRVFLMYHELEVADRPLCQSEPGYVRYIIGAGDFQEQVNWLRAAGWLGLNVSQASTAPERNAVVITFDDGCETDSLIAAPILKDAGFGATSYVTVGFVGRPGYLSPAQVRELAHAGIEIGCHSFSHPYLSDLGDDGLQEEIVVAKDRLQQMTGRAVEHFSCPGGRYNERVIKVVRNAGYKSMATSRTHVNSPTSDPFQLGRVAIMRGTSLSAFRAICEGRRLWQFSVRDRVRDGAKRLLGNALYDRLRANLLRQ